jgi:hypothetical protein
LSNRLSRFHSANDTWLLVLIGLHLAAVAWHSFVLRQPIVRGMITGDLGSTGSADGATIVDSMLVRALLIVLVLGALLALLLKLAPDAVPALF